MKRNRINHGIGKQIGRSSTSLFRACLNASNAVRNRIQSAKEKIFQQHDSAFQGQERLLKLALNEAEAIAWQTDYPHLVFPSLALEKAEAAVSWQRRQKSIQQNVESSFAA
jgi:hypothetical protein